MVRSKEVARMSMSYGYGEAPRKEAPKQLAAKKKLAPSQPLQLKRPVVERSLVSSVVTQAAPKRTVFTRAASKLLQQCAPPMNVPAAPSSADIQFSATCQQCKEKEEVIELCRREEAEWKTTTTPAAKS